MMTYNYPNIVIQTCHVKNMSKHVKFTIPKNSIESVQASFDIANSLRDGRGNLLNDRKLFQPARL